MKKLFTVGFVVILLTALPSFAQDKNLPAVNQLVVITNHPGVTIGKDIYGHFSEHLGTCIYGGLWVGKDSKIPNTDGIRNDVLFALREIKVPNLRWPAVFKGYIYKNGILTINMPSKSVVTMELTK